MECNYILSVIKVVSILFCVFINKKIEIIIYTREKFSANIKLLI
jgi:hypothetical protein